MNNRKFYFIKVILVCLILISISGVGVKAVSTKLNNVKIELSNGYEMNILTSKSKVQEILNENNIIIGENEKVKPNLDEEIQKNGTIKISNKSEQEIEIGNISENGLEVSLQNLLETYNSIIEKIEIVEEPIPFETITKDISEGSASTKNKIIQEGEDGIKKITYKVKYQNNAEIERIKISEEVIKEPVDKIVQINSNIVITNRGESSSRSRAVSGSVAEYQEYARVQCLNYGWGEYEFSCLVNLWNKESGWNPYLRNSSSGAYGIPQSLPASKMASFGSDYLTNYKTQINWGLSYISSRYGSPSSAWSHFLSKNWY